MNSLSVFVLLAVCLFALARASDDVFETARLVVTKKSFVEPVVIGEPFIINYQIKNVGNTAAQEVYISDKYGVDSFELPSFFNEQGIFTKDFAEISSGSVEEFNVTVVPKVVGIFDSTRARVQYKAESEIDIDFDDEDSSNANVKGGYSSSLGKIQIFSASDAKNYKKSSADASSSQLSFKNYGVFFAVFGIFYAVVKNFLDKNKPLPKGQKTKRG